MNSPTSIAAQIVRKCGGIDATAAMIGRHRSVVNRWLLPKGSGGTDGRVPLKHMPTLLAEAAKRGLDLRVDDFFVAQVDPVWTGPDRRKSLAHPHEVTTEVGA